MYHLYVDRVAPREKRPSLADDFAPVSAEGQPDNLARNVGTETNLAVPVPLVDVVRHEHVLACDNPGRNMKEAVRG